MDIGTLDAAHQAERIYNTYPKHQKNLLWFVLNGYLKVVEKQFQSHRGATKRKDYDAPPEKKVGVTAALATKRICELVSAKHSTDPSEFQSCSLVAFQALATMAPFSDSLTGYHDRVHSMGVLKFGPWVWESIAQGSDPPDGKDISDPDLHPKDYKTLSLLVSIYGQHEEHLDRALAVLDLMFDSFSPEELRDSLTRDTFHTLITSLVRRQKLRMKAESNGSHSVADTTSKSPELDIALQLLDRMMIDNSWFPLSDTFYITFRLALHSGNDADRVRTKVEACRFVHGSVGNDVDDPSIAGMVYPISPVKAAKFALNAWVETVENSGGEILPGDPDPSERAWDILRSLQIASAPLFLPAEAVSDIYDLAFSPDASSYILALKICGRSKSKNALAVAMRILDAVEREGIIMKGSVCVSLVRAINNSSDIEQRIKGTKRVYLLVANKDAILKKSIRETFEKNLSYFQNVHQPLYEEEFGELDLGPLNLTDISTTGNKGGEEPLFVS
ncbi:MAG: hypothetical protein SGILL_004969 [Bacillariaceae sp.]